MHHGMLLDGPKASYCTVGVRLYGFSFSFLHSMKAPYTRSLCGEASWLDLAT